MIFKKRTRTNSNRNSGKTNAISNPPAKGTGQKKIVDEYFRFKISQLLTHNRADKLIRMLIAGLFFSIPFDLLIVPYINSLGIRIPLTFLVLVYIFLAFELPLKALDGITKIISMQTKTSINKYLAYGLPALAVIIALVEVFSRLKINSIATAIFWVVVVGIGIINSFKNFKTSNRQSGQIQVKEQRMPDPLLSFYSMLVMLVVITIVIARLISLFALADQNPLLVALSDLVLLSMANSTIHKIDSSELVFCTKCRAFSVKDKGNFFRCICSSSIK